MAKVPVPVEDILNNPRVSISSSPFAPGKMIIKKASFPGGKVPEHLKDFIIDKNPCEDVTGTVTYKGKKIPAAAVCLAAIHNPRLLLKYPEIAKKIRESENAGENIKKMEELSARFFKAKKRAEGISREQYEEQLKKEAEELMKRLIDARTIAETEKK